MNDMKLGDLKTPEKLDRTFQLLSLLENFCYLKWNEFLFGKPLNLNLKRTWG